MRYGNGPEVLRDVSFTLEPGTFHFLTGASGAGKSSLLRLMYLAHRPSRGLITMFGHDVASLKRAELPPLRRRIGVVFQNFRLLDHLSALDNVALPLRVAGAKEGSGPRTCRRAAELGRPWRPSERQAGHPVGRAAAARRHRARRHHASPAFSWPTSRPATSMTGSACACSTCSRN